jgi:PKD domain
MPIPGRRGRKVISGLIGLCAGLWVAARCPMGRAEMLPIFGPATFARGTGAPQTALAGFRSCEPAARYKLVVQNGNSDGSGRVSSAQILLNDQPVIGPSDLNQKVARVETPVSVSADNRLSVLLASDPGSRVTASIECTANCLDVQITTPASGTTINRPQTLVLGTVSSSSDEVGVVANNVIAQVQESRFAAMGVPLSIGSTQIVVTATNACLNRATATTAVDTARIDPPAIVVTPLPSRGTAPLAVLFKATASMPTPAQIYQWDFNGTGTIDTAGSGLTTLSHTYAAPGLYLPTVTVIDSAGNQLSESTVVSVVSIAELVATLTSRWNGFKAALSSGDAATALTFFDAAAAAKFTPVFNALGPDLGQIAGTLGDMSLVSTRGELVEFSTVRLLQGQPFAYFIYFGRDGNGLWKITSL